MIGPLALHGGGKFLSGDEPVLRWWAPRAPAPRAPAPRYEPLGAVTRD